MIQNYTGNRLPLVAVLRHSSDVPATDGLLECLEGHGFRMCILDENSKNEKIIKKSCAVIAVLSDAFNHSEHLADALITAEGTGREIIPANIDGSVPDESLNRAFHARNCVFRSRYSSDEEFAGRLLTADSLKKPFVTDQQKRAAKILTIGAAAGAAAVLLAMFFAIKSSAGVAPADVPEGENEFLQYTDVALLGDELVDAKTIWDVCAEDRDEDGRRIWRKLSDGSVVARASSDDLSFLQYMTNLNSLILVNQTAAELPDLSGIKNLRHVELWECDISDLSAFSVCQNLTFMHVTARVSDMSQFNDIPTLMSLNFVDDYDGGCLKTLDGFNAKHLKSIQIQSNNLTDISAISGSPYLTYVEINAPKARDFSCLGLLTSLEDLLLDHCEGCEDLGCLSACTKLRRIHLQDLWNLNGQLDCLANHDRLEEIRLFCRLNSLDFLNTFSATKPISLGFCDEWLTDFDGLAAVKNFNNLHINRSGRSLDPVLPYLEDTKIKHLQLYDCCDVDLTKLPHVSDYLEITEGNLTSLEGLQTDLPKLRLDNTTHLTTLSGIENSNVNDLSVIGCPRLKEWEPLYGHTLFKLELQGVYSLPDFESVSLASHSNLRLTSIPGVKDLSFLSPFSGNVQFSELAVVGMDDLSSIKPLENLKGDRLEISPALEEQAAEIVEKGSFSQYTVNYENLDWLNEKEFSLISLDEINELPDSLLSRVTGLTLIGDTLIDEKAGQHWDHIIENNISYYIVISPDGTETVAMPGTLQNFDSLQKLTGLKELKLIDQPLTSLDGLQSCTQLEHLEIENTPDLEDISPVFAIPSLRELCLSNVPYTSLEGIQNLRRLEAFSSCGCESVEDYAPLGEIADRIRDINLDGAPVSEWIDALEGTSPEVMRLYHCIKNRNDLELFCSKMPGVSELELSWNEDLTDLTSLLSMPNLKRVHVSPDMQVAFDSISGNNLPFILEFCE